MAHEEYTGKSAGTTITYDGGNIPTGWYKITITENGRPKPGSLDITAAGDASYTYMDDPLGGEGSPSCSVDVEGFLSVTDHQDTGLTSKTFDGQGTVVVMKKTAEDTFTMTNAVFNGLETGGAFAAVQPFKATFVLAATAGAWS